MTGRTDEVLSTLPRETDAGFAREIRTALNALCGASQSIDDGCLTPEQKPLFDLIRSSASVLEQLLLERAPKSPNRALEPQDEAKETVIDLREFLREIRSLCDMIARNQNIDLAWKQIDAELVISPSYLREVITRLVLYSVSEFEASSLVVDIYREQTSDGDELVVEVAPRPTAGTKPSARSIENSATTRGCRSSTSSQSLEACRELVEAAGDLLEINTSRNQIANARARLDTVYSPTPPNGKTTKLNTETAEQCISDLSILAVDDLITNRRVIGALLNVFAAKADYACDGLEAQTKLEQKKYDIVLMDIDMPNMAGDEAVHHFRKVEDNFNLSRTLIYAVTARCSSDDESRYRRIGFDGTIAKPISLSALHRALRLASRRRLFPSSLWEAKHDPRIFSPLTCHDHALPAKLAGLNERPPVILRRNNTAPGN